LRVSRAPGSKTPEEADYSRMPDYAWVGWLVAGVGTIAVSLVRTLIPYRANLLSIGKEEAGMILAVVSYAQAAMAFLLLRSRYWMYKPKPALLIGLSGALALMLFGFGNTTSAFFIGALLYGLYSGCIYFYLVFHSLAHPSKSAHYVAVNEMVVGIASVAGALAGGTITQIFNADTSFVLCGIVIVAVTCLQWRIFSLNKISKT
jgi:hypothetical protein